MQLLRSTIFSPPPPLFFFLKRTNEKEFIFFSKQNGEREEGKNEMETTDYYYPTCTVGLGVDTVCWEVLEILMEENDARETVAPPPRERE